MMLKQCGGSEHYKMYKKGKTWIFAGILTSFFLVTTVGTETAHADTTDNNGVKDDTQQVVQQPASQEQQVTLKTADQKDETVPPVADEPEENVTSDVEKPAADAAEKQTPAEPENTPPVVEETQDNRHIGDPVEKPAPVVTPDVAVTDKNTANSDKTENVKPVTEVTPPKTKVNPRLRSMPASQPVTAAPVAAAAATAVQADQSIDEWMPNKMLQQAIFATLTKGNPLTNPAVTASGKVWNSVSDITKDDMALLSVFSIQGPEYTTYIDGKTSFSLEGLQYAVNLTSLDLKGTNNWAWGGTMGNYQEETGLGKYNGDITDISPLQYLTKLEFLQLTMNRVSDVTPLAGLKNLTTLEMTYNHVADFSSLNYAQFTGRMIFDHQLIVNDPVVVNGKTRTYTQPITVKMPQNYPGGLTSDVGYGWMYDTLRSIYSFESGGLGTLDDKGNIVFTQIKDQVMPGSTATVFDGYKTTQLPYKYYLSRVFDDEAGGQYFSVYTPYTIGEEGQPVTVHYQDTAGEMIHPDAVLETGLVGETYTTDPLEIAGYTLKTTPENATGTFGDTTIDVTYVYTKNAGTVTPPDVTPPVVTPDQTITVTVHYQTADGTTVAPDVLVTGKAGDTYTTSPAANVLDGYELVTTPANASGTLGDSDFAITYVYEKTNGDADKVTPDTDKPTKPTAKPAVIKKKADKKVTAGGQAVQLANGKKVATVIKGGAAAKVDLTAKTGTQADQSTVTKSAAADLPQTNSSEQTSPFWGVALLVTVLGVFGFKLKRKEQ